MLVGNEDRDKTFKMTTRFKSSPPKLDGYNRAFTVIAGCNRVSFGDPNENNIVCLGEANSRDHLEFDWPQDDTSFLRVESNKAGARFSKSIIESTSDNLQQQQQNRDFDYVVRVDINKRQQQVVGFGGAFTDSASQLIMNLSEPVRKNLLNDYFGSDGLSYNMGRVPIGGTDMSTHPYSYDDLPYGQQDIELKHFKLQPEDLLYKIPLIKRVNKIRYDRQLEPLKLLAVSWSAPAWMKSNHHLVQGRLKDGSSFAYYDAYARYLIRFMNEYEARNLSMWALAPQNEPFTPGRLGPEKINFNSVNFSPEEMAKYLEHSLVPSLIKANKTRDNLKLLIWDDTLDKLERYQDAALAAASVREFVCGLAIHWYSQGLREISYRYLYEARRSLPPGYFMISTEASFIGKPQPGNWTRGERYALDLIENLNAGSVGWIDWNLALNMSGGPTWNHNYLDSAILIDPLRDVYYKNPMYYALGHVSRFIQPNSNVVLTSVQPQKSLPEGETIQKFGVVSVAAELYDPLEVSKSEFKRRFASITLNRSRRPNRVEFNFVDCKLKPRPLVLELPANSITSLAFNC